MKSDNAMIRELSASEINVVSGGMNLEDYRTSTNVYSQVRQGPYIIVYNASGQCVAAFWADTLERANFSGA
ncbi:MAG TPA: hypothetical protein VF605_16030 [Allosphingosinicella sp.]